MAFIWKRLLCSFNYTLGHIKSFHFYFNNKIVKYGQNLTILSLLYK